MSIAQWDLEIRRKRDFKEWFGLENDDGSAMDVSGYTVKAQLRQGPNITDPLIVDFTVDTTDAANGNIYLKLTDTQTNAITSSTGFYDILLIDGSGFDETYVEGQVAIKGSVTDNA